MRSIFYMHVYDYTLFLSLDEYYMSLLKLSDNMLSYLPLPTQNNNLLNIYSALLETPLGRVTMSVRCQNIGHRG